MESGKKQFPHSDVLKKRTHLLNNTEEFVTTESYIGGRNVGKHLNMTIQLNNKKC